MFYDNVQTIKEMNSGYWNLVEEIHFIFIFFPLFFWKFCCLIKTKY